MEKKPYYNKIKYTLDNIPDSFDVLEEQIDIEVQMKYFEFSKALKEKGKGENYLKDIDKLYNKDIGHEEKKEILSGLASMADVPAFRAIEKYNQSLDVELREWGILALQECKMLLKSSLLDEQQVFISTGLGGKGQKLRYFAVFINIAQDYKLTEFQQKILRDELSDQLEKNEGEVEEVSYQIGYSFALIILPLKVSLKDIFERVINESNQYGNFLSDDILVTNVKILSEKEILKLLKEKR